MIHGKTLAAVVPAYRVERRIGGVLEAMPPEIDLVLVVDVPMPARYGSGASSLNPWRVLVSFPALLLAGFSQRLFWRYLFFDVSPVAVFFLAGLALASFGAAFGSFHWIRNATEGVTTPTGTVILAAVPFILGVQLLL